MHSRRLLPGYALGLAALAFCGAASARGLYPSQFFNTLNSPAAIVSADVNGDGFPDLVEIGQDQTIAVLINKGDGTFKSPLEYYVAGNSPTALAVADLRHDGKLDIIVVNNVDNTISVLLGKGDGTFVAPTADEQLAGTVKAAPVYAVGSGPVALAIGDMNGDGIPDVLVANLNADTISILRGNGDGTFKTQTTVPTGRGPIFVALGDMTNSGRLDILVNNNFDDTLGVILNKGASIYAPMTTIKLGPQLPTTLPQMMVVGDFNHDGKQDVITTTAEADGQTVLYFTGRGDGTFNKGRSFTTGLQTTYLAVADVNGDGFQDMIAGSLANGTIRVLLGNSNGGFQIDADYPASGIADAFSVQAFTVANFRGSGKPDIALINTTGSFIQVLYNDGSGRFHLDNSYDTGATPTDVETADLNGDNHLDIVESNSADNTLGVRLGNGNGTFQALQTYKVGANPQRVLLVDLNGDGKLDAVTVNAGDSTVSVLLGNGDGTFQAAHNFDAGPNAVDIGSGDMDQNGKIDLVVANAVVNTVSILRGNGDGSFKARTAFAANTQVNGLAVGDVDHDGFPDVVTVGSGVAVLRNDKQGGLISPAVNKFGLSVDFYPAIGTRVSLADVNHDGNLDMLIADFSDNELVVLLGNRLGFFSVIPSVFPTCTNPRSVAVADLNDDGDPDVVVGCDGSSTLGVLLGNGQGGFLSTPYPSEISPRGVAIGDFNEDGQPDLVVVNSGSDNMNVLTEIPGVVAGDHAPRTLSNVLSIADGRQPVTGGFEALDVDGDPLTFVAIQLPSQGTFSYNTGFGTYIYQANTGYVGPDTMTFQVTDGVKVSNISTVSINVRSNPTTSTSHSLLGAFWLPLLPLLGLFTLLRRRRDRMA